MQLGCVPQIALLCLIFVLPRDDRRLFPLPKVLLRSARAHATIAISALRDPRPADAQGSRTYLIAAEADVAMVRQAMHKHAGWPNLLRMHALEQEAAESWWPLTARTQPP